MTIAKLIIEFAKEGERDKTGIDGGAARRRRRALYAAMKAAAVPIGERLIREEAELDRLFATRSVTPISLAAATQAIGATQAVRE